MRPGRMALVWSAFVVVVLIGSGSWLRVQQNEVAYVTRFGQVINLKAGPLRFLAGMALIGCALAADARGRPVDALAAENLHGDGSRVAPRASPDPMESNRRL